MPSRCVDCLNESVERCAVTGVTLCAEHLWYLDDGRRVSERVAQQMSAAWRTVYSPQHYLEQLGAAYPPPKLPQSAAPRIRRLPNGYDLLGWLAIGFSISSIAAGYLATSGSGAGWIIVILPHAACAWAARRNAARASREATTRAFGAVGLIASIGSALGVALTAVLLGR